VLPNRPSWLQGPSPKPCCYFQAFTLYEEAVPDSKAEVAALHSIIGALHACRIFDGDSRGGAASSNNHTQHNVPVTSCFRACICKASPAGSRCGPSAAAGGCTAHCWQRVRTLGSEPYSGALAHKATGFSAKLLKRGDQCRAVLACAHLFWQAADGGGGESAAAAAEVRGCQLPWQQQQSLGAVTDRPADGVRPETGGADA
jgi:Vacuolar protein sorting-associated protein 35